MTATDSKVLVPGATRSARRAATKAWDEFVRTHGLTEGQVLQASGKCPARRTYSFRGEVYKVRLCQLSHNETKYFGDLALEYDITSRCADIPGVPAVRGYSSTHDHEIARFALVDGVSTRHQELSIPTTLIVLCRVAYILARLSWIGVAHNDVSPRNVLLARDGRVYVIDFGLAKHAGRLHAFYRNFLRVRMSSTSNEYYVGSLMFLSYMLLKRHVPSRVVSFSQPLRRLLRRVS